MLARADAGDWAALRATCGAATVATLAAGVRTGWSICGPKQRVAGSCVASLKPGRSTGTWPIPYSQLQATVGAGAYPGTMVVYAAVPTSGLPAQDATDYAALLRFAATTGQRPGSDVGQLPSGYLPLTEADGLGTLADYTTAAAVDVAAQNGKLPSMTAPLATSIPKSTTLPSAGAATLSRASTRPWLSAAAAAAERSEQADAAAGTSPASVSSSANPESGPSTRPRAADRTVRPVRYLSAQANGDHGLWTDGLPIALVLGLALLGTLMVPALYLLGRRLGRW